MTRSQKAGVLWFLGGVAFVVAGWMDETRRPIDIAAGILFFIVGFVSIARGRRAPSS
jgi:hypothetical protein